MTAAFRKRCIECPHKVGEEGQRRVFTLSTVDNFPHGIHLCHMRLDQPCVGHMEEKKVTDAIDANLRKCLHCKQVQTVETGQYWVCIFCDRENG